MYNYCQYRFKSSSDIQIRYIYPHQEHRADVERNWPFSFVNSLNFLINADQFSGFIMPHHHRNQTLIFLAYFVLSVPILHPLYFLNCPSTSRSAVTQPNIWACDINQAMRCFLPGNKSFPVTTGTNFMTLIGPIDFVSFSLIKKIIIFCNYVSIMINIIRARLY